MAQDSLFSETVENVVVAACLAGFVCRYHGKAVRTPKKVRTLIEDPNVNVIALCPEMLGGLPCPRPAVKRVRGRVFETCDEKANRRHATGADVTRAFIAGAKKARAIAREFGVRRAIGAWNSPSCGQTGIFTRLLNADGIEITCL